MPFLETALTLLALAISLSLRPWRMMRGARLLSPTLATLVLLPWVWALPTLYPPLPEPLNWSGACLVVLMLGWPLAMPILIVTAVIAGLIGNLSPGETIGLAFWHGLLPATFGLCLGAAIRRWLPRNPFTFIIARAFIGTLLSAFAGNWLWLVHLEATMPPDSPAIDELATMVALFLMAWSDSIVTGMLTAIFVAYRPDWLATWSDKHYLPSQ